MTMLLPPPPTLELSDERARTDEQTKLVVRYPATLSDSLHEADVSFLLDLLSDPTIAWYDPMAVPASDPTAAGLALSYIRKSSDPSSTVVGWALIENGAKVGTCQLRCDDGGFLVGTSLLPSARGRGLGTAVFSALADLAYNRLGATHVAGEVEDDNIASIKALRKALYVPTDRYRNTLDNGRTPTVTRYTATKHLITVAA
jgi:RimJ/RimL family protein N-acetyltransferase